MSGKPRWRPARRKARKSKSARPRATAPPAHAGLEHSAVWCPTCRMLVPLSPSAGAFFTESSLPRLCACECDCRGEWHTNAGDGDCGFTSIAHALAVSPVLRSGVAARADEEARTGGGSVCIARVLEAVTEYTAQLQQLQLQRDATSLRTGRRQGVRERAALLLATKPAVAALRAAFAASITAADVEDAHHPMSALARELALTDEEAGLAVAVGVDQVLRVRTFVELSGSVVGVDACYWAESDTMEFFAWLLDAVVAVVDCDNSAVAFLNARRGRHRLRAGGAARLHTARPIVVMRCKMQHWECFTEGGVAAWVPKALPAALAAQLARSISADLSPSAAAHAWAATAYQMGLVPTWLVPVDTAAAAQ